MKNRLYQSSSDRIVPEFAGMASRYSQEKQKRTLAQKNRREMSCNFQYRQHVDRKIEKRYASKTLELERLQESRRSRFEDMQLKKELKQNRQAQIQRLKERNMANRVSSRKNLQQVRQSLVGRKRQIYQCIKTDIGQRQQNLTLLMSQKLKEKAKLCESIKQQEVQAQKTITNFHLKKNANCVAAYLERIRQERWLRKQNDRRARAIRKGIQLMDKTIEMKSSLLSQVEQQVSKYRSVAEEEKQLRGKQTQGSTLSHAKVRFEQCSQKSNNPQNASV